MRRGAYEQDLGQIISIDDSYEKVTVKLVPRLNKNDENNVNNYRVMCQNKLKHNQKFFISSEYVGKVATQKKNYSDILYQVYQGNFFYEGFLHKTFHIRDLVIDNVIPKLEEVEMFTKGETDEGQKRRLLEQTNQ